MAGGAKIWNNVATTATNRIDRTTASIANVSYFIVIPFSVRLTAA